MEQSVAGMGTGGAAHGGRWTSGESPTAVHGGRVYDYARESGRRVEDIVDFSANINPLGPPASVLEAILRAMDGIRHYPDPEQRAVRQVLAETFGLPGPEWVFCGNGAAEVLDLFLRALGPRRVFLFDPAFAEYEAAARRCGVTVVRLPLPDVGVWPRAGAAGGTPPEPAPGDLVILNHPHNPTGRLWTRADLAEVVVPLAAAGVFILVDESFMDFRWDERDRTALPLALAHERVVVIRSATKMYSIPGLRFGFGVANPEWVGRIQRDRDGWSVNHLAQAAAAAAYRDEAFREETWRWLQEEQAFVARTWGRVPGMRLHAPGANFFLLRLEAPADVEDLLAAWAAEGMYVRRCDSFRGLDGRHLRVAIRRREENRRLWEAFVRWLGDGGALGGGA
ncbi:MAG: threonine-phosphate decarboxylase CobD [Alicyclobacillus macrosporangiidus]|uniref:threonine-phosphate decarboxylase CobD n=1 Tax=Alicyclobacillus macrosporangiidus TaxID=392015 RepID=UPI0026EF1743|nr:threonine-phosphate decarboxylase CobD [Alicyclobacillus macrosporangiidus]MCL6600380.1 threonine-phosphate decarboxylase CobD [Alicyclobacillus macrosporangiidus]